MEKISVTRGLVQLKRLDKRIYDKMSDMSDFVTVNKVNSKKVLNGTYTKEDYVKKVKAQWQSIQDLINLRNEIKSAIVISNANTKVTIVGKEYTVAQAIERKTNIENYELPINSKLRKAYRNAFNGVGIKNQEIEETANKLFASSSDDKKNKSDSLELIEKYIETNKWEIIDPINLKELVDQNKKEINDFLAEVDEVLTESNSTTMIEISRKSSDIE